MIKLFAKVPDEVPDNLRHLIKSIPEEQANKYSHAVGLLIFMVAVPLMIWKVQLAGLIPCLVFGVSLLMVYSSSTLYHSVYKLSLKTRLRMIDHMFIYFLIAGTFTPFIVMQVKSNLGMGLLGLLWLMVFVGSIFKYFFTHRFNFVSTLAYVGMGGMAFFIATPLSENLEPISLNLLLLGGLSYLIGVVFYLWKGLYYNHLYWHIFVLIGSVCHYLAVWFMI